VIAAIIDSPGVTLKPYATLVENMALLSIERSRYSYACCYIDSWIPFSQIGIGWHAINNARGDRTDFSRSAPDVATSRLKSTSGRDVGLLQRGRLTT
jgi:hypothetical protein